MSRTFLLFALLFAFASAQTCQPGAGLPGCTTAADCPALIPMDCLPTPATATDPAGTCCPKTAVIPAGATTNTAATTTSRTIVTTRRTNTSCVDLLNPRTGVSDCPARAALCNDTTYYDVMTRQCPKTCGRCNITGNSTVSGACVDRLNPKTGVSDCPGLSRLCNDATYLTVMTTQCPKTCGRCTTGGSNITITATTTRAVTTCVDKTNTPSGVSDCARRANLCTNAAYRTLMQEQCPKTCGFC